MMGKRNAYIILMAETEGKRLPSRLCKDGREILNGILGKNCGCDCRASTSVAQVSVEGCCDHNVETEAP